MGYGTYETTHENVIKSGKRLFMQNGYERTNLRELCKEAGITTGSFYRHFASKEELFGYLVQPAIDGLYKMYDASKELCFDSIETERIKELWKISNDTLQNLVDFIYQNFDSFKLLLECADGTKYSSFVNDVVTMEVQNTLKMLDVMHERGIIVKDLCENEFHMLSHAFLSCVFESVMHNYGREDTLAYVYTMVEFFNAGWQKVLGL